MPNKTILLSLIFLTACSTVPAVGNQTKPEATLTPFAPLAATQTRQAEALFLADPEKVVQSFLTDVQEAPAQVNSYLSRAMQKKYPGSEVIRHLGLKDNISGFVIKAVDANFRDPLAYVTVLLGSGDQVIGLRFTLVIENSIWVIDGIDQQPLEQ